MTLVTCQAKLSKECLVDYLKFRGVNDESFQSIDAYSGDPGTCTDDVKAKVKEIYETVRSKMESHIKQQPHADCAMKQVESESFENILLRAEVIELKGVGLKFWKISSKKSRIEELQKQAQEVIDNALIDCKGQSDYGAFFDMFYEDKRVEPMTDEFDYCMRKHLLDKTLISSTQYQFKVNPKNLRTANIYCDDIMKTALDQMRANIASAGTSCVRNTFVDNGYLDLIMKIQLLAKLTLNYSEKEEEKKKFVDAMIKMTHQIKSCPM